MVSTQQYVSYIPTALDDMSWLDSYEGGNGSKFDDAYTKNEGA
jgi:hypothetical protein